MTYENDGLRREPEAEGMDRSKQHDYSNPPDAENKAETAAAGPAQDIAARCLAAFEGSAVAHGWYDPAKAQRKPNGKIDITGAAETRSGEATVELWDRHVNGAAPLGIIPQRADGTTLWGCIDVDDRTLNHGDIIRQIEGDSLPLVPCRSKSGGLHLYLFLGDPKPSAYVRETLEQIARYLGIDPKLPTAEIFPKQDASTKEHPGSFLNMPYFAGEAGGRYAYNGDGAILDAEEFLTRAERRTPGIAIADIRLALFRYWKEHGERPRVEADDHHFAKRELERLAERLARQEEGSRHNLTYGFAKDLGRFVGAGWLAEDDVFGTLREAVVRNGLPLQDGERAIRDGIAAGRKEQPKERDRAAQAGAGGSGGGSANAGELQWHSLVKAPAPQWLVKKLLPRTGAALLSGQWGTGKTFVALDLAGSVVTGTDFAGRRVKRIGGVLILAAEAAGDLPFRLEGLVEGKLAPNEPTLFEGPRKPLPIAWVDHAPPLLSGVDAVVARAKEAAAKLREEHEVELALVIVDTMAAAAGFSAENESAEGQKAMNACAEISRQTGALVLAIDHFGKDESKGTRGTSAKEASADAVLALTDKEEQPDGSAIASMKVRKLRNGPTGSVTYYRLPEVGIGVDDDGDAITTCTVEWDLVGQLKAKAAPKARPPKVAKHISIMMQALGRVTLPTPTEELRKIVYEIHGGTDGACRKAFNEGLKDCDLERKETPEGEVIEHLDRGF